MPGELDQNMERQLRAFGRTLESRTGEPIRSEPVSADAETGRANRRWWAIGGAAACVIAVVGALVVTDRPESDPPVASPSTGTSTTIGIPVTTMPVVAAPPAPVPDDPLALERDGWTLVQRDVEPFAFAVEDVPCPDARALGDFDGVAQVHDILTPPESDGLDLDVQILDTGSVDRGNRLADAVLAIGACLGETEGVEVEALSSIRASWFRAGPQFALATVVGEQRSIVLEIENADVDDELIAFLVHRADAYLSGAEIVREAGVAPSEP